MTMTQTSATSATAASRSKRQRAGGRPRTNGMTAPAAAAAAAAKTPSATPTAPALAPRPSSSSKSAIVVKLLSRGRGASGAELAEATGWQPHTVRAHLSGLRKKGTVVVREARKSGDTAYRIVDVPDRQSERPSAATGSAPGHETTCATELVTAVADRTAGGDDASGTNGTYSTVIDVADTVAA